MNEAGIEAKQAKEKAIAARHIRKVQTVSCAYFRKRRDCNVNVPSSTCSRNSMHEQAYGLALRRITELWG